MISVICPAYNEVNYIRNILSFFIESKPAEKELLIIDGGSKDGTREEVLKQGEKNPKIKLIDNPMQTVPFALNLGIKNSRGDIIIRIDAHTIYSLDYFEKIIETFDRTGADIVGGPTRIQADSPMQEAIGFTMSHPFGIGGSKVHDENFEGYANHVTFGAWRREIFKDIGFFDERLKRNQDDEFHYRAASLGKKIYLNPEIKLWYIPRRSILTFFIQYFQFGLYKPLVLKKIKSGFKLRHIIPSLFVIYLFTLPLSFFQSYRLIPLGLYFFIIMILSFNAKIKIPYILIILFPVIHVAYGTGFLLGLIKSEKAIKENEHK
ncbi:MAG TPA: glycosyltransferase family 2 protein [Ignavibacteriaceae bacterium]|nr:glycosyltransferase family 2 protein [Ignavibacteriaceae bacterium]